MSLPGVTFLDHTADVGMDLEARSFGELLHRSALGMLALLRGEEEEDGEAPDSAPANGDTGSASRRQAGTRAPEEPDSADAVAVSLRAEDAPGLMAAWLREILYLHEVRDLDFVAAEWGTLDPRALEGWVRVRRGGHAAREIKGVTYHELEVEASPDGSWRARVIFDV